MEICDKEVHFENFNSITYKNEIADMKMTRSKDRHVTMVPSINFIYTCHWTALNSRFEMKPHRKQL